MNHLPENLNWSVIKNTVSQIVGRMFISISRLVIAIIVVRYGNTLLFGQYALILSLLFVAEWLVDFGTTDIGVRNICRQPNKKFEILKTLTYLKLPQFVFAYVSLVAFVVLMGYDSALVRAALFGGVGLAFQAGAVIYRTLFRTTMQMEKDVAGELVGVLLMIPLIWFASWKGAGVDILAACYAVSRAAYFFVVLIWGNKQFRLNLAGVTVREVATFYPQALPLGLLGVLVVGYDSIALVILSKFMDMQAVAFYSAATRFLLPIMVVTNSITKTFYPILSSYWNKSSNNFRNTQQNCLEVSFLVAGALFCMINAAAEFFMGLIGQDFIEAAYILRILSWAILGRAVTTAMSPLIIVSGSQGKALGLALFSLIPSVFLMLWLVPLYGVLGAALAVICTEFLFSMIPAIFASLYLTSIKLNWLPVAKVLFCAVLALVFATILGQKGTIWGAAIAVLSYLALVLFTGALPLSKLHVILESIRTRKSPAPPPPGGPTKLSGQEEK